MFQAVSNALSALEHHSQMTNAMVDDKRFNAPVEEDNEMDDREEKSPEKVGEKVCKRIRHNDMYK